MQRHSKSPLAIQNVVSSISTAPGCQISFLLKDFFFFFFFQTMGASVRESGDKSDRLRGGNWGEDLEYAKWWSLKGSISGQPSLTLSESVP